MCDFGWLMEYFVQYLSMNFTCMVIKNLAVNALKLQIGYTHTHTHTRSIYIYHSNSWTGSIWFHCFTLIIQLALLASHDFYVNLCLFDHILIMNL